MHGRVLALASLLVLALAAPARADEGQQKPDFAAAKRHFKAGQEFLQMDRYADAVVEFKKAYDITKDGLVMGQVAEAYAKAGDFEAALGALQVYRGALPEGERAAADELKKEYQRAVKDGRSKRLVLPAAEQPQADAAAPPPPRPEVKARRKGRLWTWIVAGTAGALALSALVVGLNAQSKFDDLNNSGCKPRCPDSEVDSVRTRAVVADVLWGTAAAAAVTSVVLFFVEGRAAAASASDQKAPGEDGGGGSGDEETVSRRKVRFAPVVGAGNYGLSAHIRF